MASIIHGAKIWIQKKAIGGQRASLQHRFPGLRYEPNCTFTTKETALNLGKALYYYARSSIVNDLRSFDEPVMDLIPTRVGLPVAQSKRPVKANDYYLLASSQNKTSGSGSTVRKDVRHSIRMAEEKVVSFAEIAFKTKLGIKVVMDAVEELKKKGEVEVEGNFVYDSNLQEHYNVRELLQEAGKRDEGRWNTFMETRDEKLNDIEIELPKKAEEQRLIVDAQISEIIRILNKDKDEIGIRDKHLGIFIRKPKGSDMVTYQQDLPIDISGNTFVAMGKTEIPYYFDVDFTEDDKVKLAKKHFKKAGLKWDKELFNSLASQGIERLMIFNGYNSEQDEIQIQLIITNPIFFEKEKEKRVIRDLNRLAKAAGRRIGEIRGKGAEKPLIKETLSRTQSDYDRQKELEFWNWVFTSGKGNYVGLEPKIDGPITNAHRRDFEMAMSSRIEEAMGQGKVVVWEDAAGEIPMALRLEKFLTKEAAGKRVLRKIVATNLECIARDFVDGAVSRARANLEGSLLKDIVRIEQGDMFERSERDDNSVDFIVGSMPFYCTREKFRTALLEWARIAKPGALGWFSMKEKDGDLKVVLKETKKMTWQGFPLWQKILLPVAALKFLGLYIRKRLAGSYDYMEALTVGFRSGKYYAPTEEDLREDLEATGLQALSVQGAVANQFRFVTWKLSGETEEL